jgi:hypothetical protein
MQTIDQVRAVARIHGHRVPATRKVGAPNAWGGAQGVCVAV